MQRPMNDLMGFHLRKAKQDRVKLRLQVDPPQLKRGMTLIRRIRLSLARTLIKTKELRRIGRKHRRLPLKTHPLAASMTQSTIRNLHPLRRLILRMRRTK
jgi:hypothetical protein